MLDFFLQLLSWNNWVQTSKTILSFTDTVGHTGCETYSFLAGSHGIKDSSDFYLQFSSWLFLPLSIPALNNFFFSLITREVWARLFPLGQPVNDYKDTFQKILQIVYPRLILNPISPWSLLKESMMLLHSILIYVLLESWNWLWTVAIFQ